MCHNSKWHKYSKHSLVLSWAPGQVCVSGCIQILPPSPLRARPLTLTLIYNPKHHLLVAIACLRSPSAWREEMPAGLGSGQNHSLNVEDFNIQRSSDLSIHQHAFWWCTSDHTSLPLCLIEVDIIKTSSNSLSLCWTITLDFTTGSLPDSEGTTHSF